MLLLLLVEGRLLGVGRVVGEVALLRRREWALEGGLREARGRSAVRRRRQGTRSHVEPHRLVPVALRSSAVQRRCAIRRTSLRRSLTERLARLLAVVEGDGLLTRQRDAERRLLSLLALPSIELVGRGEDRHAAAARISAESVEGSCGPNSQLGIGGVGLCPEPLVVESFDGSEALPRIEDE